MKLIVGLGNPGERYNFTRHNFGFLALDFYAKIREISWQKPKFNALWARQGEVIFLKPQTFYNESGQAVQEFCRFYKIAASNVLVVCDDFDLEFGQLRFRAHGSSAGNNGLKSITAHLGTENFPRLRLGTNNTTLRQQLGDIDFVLARFAPTERERLPELLSTVARRLDDWQNSRL